MSEALFQQDAYLKTCAATVVEVNERGGIVLDRTIFYATGGGQPGDTGAMTLPDGRSITIATTVYGEHRAQIVHVPTEGSPLPQPGDQVNVNLDWDRRYKLMRVHTALHLMCALVPFPVTGGQIGEDGGRLDFDIENPDAIDKDELTEKLQVLVAASHPVSQRWITDAELDANPGLVRTMSVQPPRGSGKVRLVAIGEDGSVDLQPCGGTHVASTAEIGGVAITRVEKKGRNNRRFRLALLD
ncbi:MAG: alanyl-tRNA editing protein [Anderseniella sp.]|jgi:misacylated tRNA(Ala) deacylase|nr:alanyl-tRNA editing protein [Anderseniella sp.]